MPNDISFQKKFKIFIEMYYTLKGEEYKHTSFAKELLLTRQSVANFFKQNNISECSDNMLFHLYYYFNEKVVIDSITDDVLSECVIYLKNDLINELMSERNRRVIELFNVRKMKNSHSK